MSGIVCCSKFDSTLTQANLEKVITTTFLGKQAHQATGSDDFVSTTVVATPGSCASKAICKSSGLTIFVDGYFVETLDQRLSSAEWLLQTFKEQKESCFGRLNGSYNILIVDNKAETVTLVTDRYGTRPLVFVENETGFAISYSSESFVTLGIIEKVLNENLVANALSFSRVWYNDETFYQGVKCIQGGSVLKWSAEQGVSITKFPIEKLYCGETPTITKLASLFREVISEFQKVPNIGISLSGGLDSRMLLASGFQGESFTWGYRSENDEILLAQKCAEQVSIPWNFIKLEPEDFLDLNCKGDLFREGLDIFVQSYGLKVYQEVANKGVTGLMTGLALDVTLAGSYSPKLTDKITSSKIKDFAFSKIEYFSPALRKKLIASPKINEKIEEIESEIIGLILGDFSEDDSLLTISSFFLEHRVRRCLFQRQLWQRAFVEDYIPTFDNRLVDYIELFSLEERAEHKIFRELLLELSLELAEIPYQGTNLPASVPTMYWSEATQIEQKKEALTRKVFFETKGKRFVPYNRYYSNFDEWLRVNDTWINEVKRLLLSDDSLILKYLDRNEIERLITEQLQAKNSHYGRLVILMSLEKTLRLFS